MCTCASPGPSNRNILEVRRFAVKLPHHQCGLTSMARRWVRQMLHQVRPSDLCFAKGTIFSTDSLVTRFTNSTCSFSTSAHSNCTAAMFGNASGLNNASRRVLKSVKKAELWNGSFDGAKAAAPDHARNAQR